MTSDTAPLRAFPSMLSILHWVITAGGLSLRWYHLNLISFTYDGAMAMFRARETFLLGHPPLTGIVNSLGFHNPAGFIWLILPPALLSPDPRWTAAWIGLLTVAGTWPVMRVAWEVFGTIPAVIAGAAYALLPSAIFNGRSIWAQHLLPPLGAWALLFLWMSLGQTGHRRRMSLGSCAIFVLLAALVHLSAIVWLVPVLFVPLQRSARNESQPEEAVFWRRGKEIALIAACALLFLAFIPSVLDWATETLRPTALKPAFVRMFEEHLAPPKPVAGRLSEALSGLFAPLQSLSATAGIAAQVRGSGFVRACDFALLICAITGFARAVVLARRKAQVSHPQEIPFARLLLIWIFAPALIASIILARFNGSYLALSFPCIPLALACAAAGLRRFRWSEVTALPVCAFLCVVYAIYYIACIQSLNRTRCLLDQYRIPLIEQSLVARHLSDSGVPAGNFIHLSGEWYGLPYRYLHEQVWRAPARSRTSNPVGIVQNEFLRQEYPESMHFVRSRATYLRPQVDVVVLPDENSARVFLNEVSARNSE